MYRTNGTLLPWVRSATWRRHRRQRCQMHSASSDMPSSSRARSCLVADLEGPASMRSMWDGAIWQPWLIFYLPHWDCVCVSLSACVSALHNWPPRRRSRTAHTRGGRGRSAAPSGLTLSQARKSARQRERGLQKHQKSGRSLHFIFMVM